MKGKPTILIDTEEKLIEHFGKPRPPREMSDAEARELLERASIPTPPLWVKRVETDD